jgi:hypothetical protein
MRGERLGGGGARARGKGGGGGTSARATGRTNTWQQYWI